MSIDMRTAMKRLALALAVPLFAGFVLCACARIAVAPHDPACLWNMQQARNYTAQGRYELAKEHYLLALAASNEPETKSAIAHELQSVDKMIQTLR